MESEILVTLDNYKKLIGKKVVLVQKNKSSEMEQTEGESSTGKPVEGKERRLVKMTEKKMTESDL